jgi:Ca2+-binding RTX toxin-like protein
VGVEDLHFYMANPTFDPNQFVNIRLAATQYGEWVSGGDVGDALRIGDFPGAKNADGRGGDDLIIGDGQDNYINGGAGSDTIDGGAGRNDIAGFQLPAGATGALRVVDGVGEYAGKLVVERVDGAVVEAVFVVTPTAGGGAVVQGSLGGLHGRRRREQRRRPALHRHQQLQPVRQRAACPDPVRRLDLRSETSDTIDIAAFPGGRNSDGGRGDDLIIGDAQDNYLIGGGGDDTLNGGGGKDVASFQLPTGTPGTLRVTDGVGANAGKLVVERVDGATVEPSSS